jgi:hypothetical protein
MFTVERRDALSEHVVGLAKEDERVVAGAVVGSLAAGPFTGGLLGARC